ncbi:hypothetical protein [Caulobacter sp. DWR1-3-2b1]|uniref:hypothetical protein n=1 Tax=Caulobacter sp. DWR1-3-2b1 TaxID=2804670 RepID=UPI003CF3869F
MASGAAQGDAQTCLRVARPVAAGVLALDGDFEAAGCRGAEPARRAFRRDRSLGYVVAARDLTPGEILAAPPLRLLAAWRPGQSIRLRVRAGQVTLERSVQVVRPAARGEPVFVRGNDGAVFSASAAMVAP